MGFHYLCQWVLRGAEIERVRLGFHNVRRLNDSGDVGFHRILEKWIVPMLTNRCALF